MASATTGAKELSSSSPTTGCDARDATVPAARSSSSSATPAPRRPTRSSSRTTTASSSASARTSRPAWRVTSPSRCSPASTSYCTFQNDTRDDGVGHRHRQRRPRPSADDRQLTAPSTDYKAYVEDETGELVGADEGVRRRPEGRRHAEGQGPVRPDAHPLRAIEPIAESFGNLDPQIDARVNDVDDGSKWTGFHQIEQILWRQDTTDGHRAGRRQAARRRQELHAKSPRWTSQAAQIANGAVELLDEVSSSKITGEEDRYSHTDLSDFQGNFTGAKAAFERSSRRSRSAATGALVDDVDAQVRRRSQRALDRYKRDTPLGYALYAELTHADRRQLAAADRRAGRAAVDRRRRRSRDRGMTSATSTPPARTALTRRRGCSRGGGALGAVAARRRLRRRRRPTTARRPDAPRPSPSTAPHQAGITTPAQDRLVFGAFDLSRRRARDLRELLRSWTARRAADDRRAPDGAVAGQTAAAPPADTGEALGLPPRG